MGGASEIEGAETFGGQQHFFEAPIGPLPTAASRAMPSLLESANVSK
jgi:hypothetical protein